MKGKQIYYKALPICKVLPGGVNKDNGVFSFPVTLGLPHIT